MEANELERKLIATYARVSTATQEQEETVKNQLSALREFAAAHSYEIVQEYIDEGWSGDILARPQLDKLRQDAPKKIWQAVLIYDPDRLARRYSYQELVMDELRERGIEVLFVTTPSPKTGEEKILHGVKGLFAEYERAKITERFRLGKVRKAREGNVLLSEAPYGYRYVPKSQDGRGHFEINPHEAEVLSMIFRWVTEEGVTIRGVVRRLAELGVRPRKSKRGVWSPSTIGHLLRNRTFIGEAHYGASYAVVPQKRRTTEVYRKHRKTSRRQKPESEWIKIPVPAIIDGSLFERTQQQLKKNFALSRRNRKNEYLLSGKIWCICGTRRAGEGPQRGKHLYYRCVSRVHSFPLPSTCEEKGINARFADAAVWNKVALLMSDPKLLQKQIRRWANQREATEERNVNAASVTSAELSKLKEQEERYTRAYGAGLLSLEQLRTYKLPLRDKIVSLEKQIAGFRQVYQAPLDNHPPSSREVALFARRSAQMLQNLNFAARQAIVRNVIEKVVVSANTLDIHGIIPVGDANQANVTFSPIHRHRWDTNRHKIPFHFRISLPAPSSVKHQLQP